MTSAHTTLTRCGNALGVWLYRRSDGRIAGPGKGTAIGLITVPGRNTGIPRTVAVGFFPHGADYVVAGSGSRSKRDPHWFRNLRAAAHAQIQIGATHVTADVRVAGDAERDRLWLEVIMAQAPWRHRYEKKAGWVIRVAVLTPRQPGHDESDHTCGPATVTRRVTADRAVNPRNHDHRRWAGRPRTD